MKKKNYNQIFRVDASGKFFEVSDTSFNIDRVKFLFRELNENNTEKATLEYYLDMPDFFYLVEVINDPRLSTVIESKVKERKLYDPLWQVEGGASVLKLAQQDKSRPDGKPAAWRLKLLPSTKPNSIMLQTEIGAGADGKNGGIVFQGKAEKFIGVPVEIPKIKGLLEYALLQVKAYYNAYGLEKYSYAAKQRVQKEKDKFWSKENK